MIEIKTDEIKLINNYDVKFEKKGFYISWKISDELGKLLQKKTNINFVYLKCHMSIWTKIFYDKHRQAFTNFSHKESKFIKNIDSKLIDCINKNKIEVEDDNDRKNHYKIKINEVFKINEKEIIFLYVLGYSKKDENIKIISVHRRNKKM